MRKRTDKLIIASVFIGISVLSGDVQASTQTQFIDKLTPSVKQATSEYNLYASLQMAQAALESGWGQSRLSTEANNYFGIKGSYNGQYVVMNTAEYDANGNLYYVDAQFRKYPSPTESMQDNASHLRNGVSWNPEIYAGTWRERAANGRDAARGLVPSYATDPNYATKLISIIDSYGLEYLDQKYTATYKVGDKVQIASYATNEANGYDLRPRQNWVGTVKSVTANNQGNSHFEYYVEYGNADENNMHVLEQDLQAAPAEKYKQGDVVSIATGAISGTTGQSLTEYRGFTGTVKSVKIKNHASSHYQYALDVGGKTVSYIPEQDVVDAPARKYKAGDKVAISSAANVESNGHNLQPRRGYIGTVKSSAIMNKYSSHYEYYVDYGDGTGNGHVLEQDLITPPAAKYKVGDKVKILNSANVESNGYNLQPRRGWVGTVKSIAIMNKYSSHYEYYIDYGDGTANEHVLEQDLTKNVPTPKYKVGQTITIASDAINETNGHNLVPRRGWVGLVKSVVIKNHASSHYEYYIDYTDGTGNGHVSEQDISETFPAAKFKAGDKVKVSDVALSESNGSDLISQRNKAGVVRSMAIKNSASSHYEYWVDYADGTRSEHVLEQDLLFN